MLNIEVSDGHKTILINGVSSILAPKDNTCLFVGKKMVDKIERLEGVCNCLIFVLNGLSVPDGVSRKNIIRYSNNSRKDFGKFLESNNADSFGEQNFQSINGAMISDYATLGKNVIVQPFAVIEAGVVLGDNTIIGYGTKILKGTKIGSNCRIAENVSIGVHSLAYEEGQRIPQVGNVFIADNVDIGTGTIIGRGAIEDTRIEANVKIDCYCYIGHNDKIGANTLLVAGTNLFGSVTIGHDSYISGNSVIRNGVTVGVNSIIGMGSVVTKNVPNGITVVGNPAHLLERK